MTTNTLQQALLPCPFCGCDACIVGDADSGGVYVACQSPECWCAVGEIWDRDGIPDHAFATESDAIAAWNRRALPVQEPVAWIYERKIFGDVTADEVWLVSPDQNPELARQSVKITPLYASPLPAVQQSSAKDVALPDLSPFIKWFMSPKAQDIASRLGWHGIAQAAWQEATRQAERNYPEDKSIDEYLHNCSGCCRLFIGRKGRMLCKVCAAAPVAVQPPEPIAAPKEE